MCDALCHLLGCHDPRFSRDYLGWRPTTRRLERNSYEFFYL